MHAAEAGRKLRGYAPLIIPWIVGIFTRNSVGADSIRPRKTQTNRLIAGRYYRPLQNKKRAHMCARLDFGIILFERIGCAFELFDDGYVLGAHGLAAAASNAFARLSIVLGRPKVFTFAALEVVIY